MGHTLYIAQADLEHTLYVAQADHPPFVSQLPELQAGVILPG